MDFDLNAHLAEIEQYQRDVNALYQSTEPEDWTRVCDELAEWNAAIQAQRDDA